MQLSFKSKERSMKRKLFVYMFFLVTTISITLLMGLFLFGRINGTLPIWKTWNDRTRFS